MSKLQILENKTVVFFLLFLINIGVMLGSFFYPVLRDEFYYVNSSGVNLFEEYKNAYFVGNPRIGQFFSNAIGRSNSFVQVIFSVLLFNGFVSALYLNIFRTLPNVHSKESLRSYIVISSVFLLLINYFGEMFWYIPFSTNYTLLNILYLVYVYVIVEYFFYGKQALNKIPVLLVVLFGFITGMGNEHVPPALLLVTSILGIHHIFTQKKIPSFKVVAYAASLLFGYLFLFFSPASRNKFRTVGAEEFGFSFSNYFKGWVSIAKNLYYYNSELIVFSIISLALAIYLKRTGRISRQNIVRMLFYLAISVITFFVVAYSPLTGTRLLFFSNSLVICCILIVFFKVIESRYKVLIQIGLGVFLVLMLTLFDVISYNAQNNYISVINEVSRKSLNKDVILEKSFDYRSAWAGPLNRKVLLEDGTEYIDDQPQKDNFAELGIKGLFNLRTISVKNENRSKTDY